MSNCLAPGPALQGGLLRLCRHDKRHACRNLEGCKSAREGENGLVTLLRGHEISNQCFKMGEMIIKKKA